MGEKGVMENGVLWGNWVQWGTGTGGMMGNGDRMRWGTESGARVQNGMRWRNEMQLESATWNVRPDAACILTSGR